AAIMIEWMQYVLHAFPRAVILRSERAFISAFTRVFNALWRASLEGWRAPLCRKVRWARSRPFILRGSHGSPFEARFARASGRLHCSHLRMTVRRLSLRRDSI